jgi:hypothetical protein
MSVRPIKRLKLAAPVIGGRIALVVIPAGLRNGEFL